MKKFKASELLSREQMRKVSGSGYCNGDWCNAGTGFGVCTHYQGQCRCYYNGQFLAYVCN